MQAHLSIGENHRFELHEALLIYRDRQSSFITRHDVNAHKDAPPTLGPAQPLTVAFIESLTRSLSGSVQAEVLPAKVLAKADRMIVWWTPTRRRQMFYENSEGKAAELNGRIFPQPPLVWKVSNGELIIRALTEFNETCRRALLESFRQWARLHRHYAAPGLGVCRVDSSLGTWLL
jgi:PRTRC genetic system protein B